MSKYSTDTTEGCAIVCVALVLVVIIWFAMPWVCIMGWAPIAAAWNLPTFTYWQWFWMSWLIRFLFKGSSGASVSRSK